ncbi:SUKH-3 domain-containing protein [Deinococcus sp. UYEF24]
MSVTQIENETVRAILYRLDWFEERHVDLTYQFAELAKRGWVPFKQARDFLERFEGLGNRDAVLYSCKNGTENYRDIRYIERHLGTKLFPIGAEDSWMKFLIGEDGRYFVCDLPFSISIYRSFEDFILGNASEETYLKKPSPNRPEWNTVNFKMVFHRFCGKGQKSSEYEELTHRKLLLGLNIFRNEHKFSEFKSGVSGPIDKLRSEPLNTHPF